MGVSPKPRLQNTMESETEDDRDVTSYDVSQQSEEITTDDGEYSSNGHLHLPSVAPKDRFFLVYIALFLVGMGVLFPWNSLVSAMDYFLFLYRPYNPEVAIPVTYLVVTLAAMGFTIATVNLLPLHVRIGFGNVMFVIVLVAIPLLDIGIHNCTIAIPAGFSLTLAGVILVGSGSGVQQSSIYGLAGVLPGKWYTQAIMAGESAAGMTVAISRVITKASVANERFGAIAFFIISLLFILLCIGCQVFLRFSPFVTYHMKKFQAEKATIQGAVSTRLKREFVTSNSMNSEDESAELIQNDVTQKTVTKRLIDGITVRVRMIVKLWKLLLTVFIVFKVTLLVFPGITSQVQNCNISDWSPVILVLAFNTSDFISRWVALLPFQWKPTHLLIISVCRYLLVPLMVLSVTPSPSHPLIPFPLIWAVILILIVGATTGYFGTQPMVLAPKLVDNEHREIAGTITAFFLLAGLATGSILAYALVPLTTIADFTACVNGTNLFTTCGNTSNVTLS